MVLDFSKNKDIKVGRPEIEKALKDNAKLQVIYDYYDEIAAFFSQLKTNNRDITIKLLSRINYNDFKNQTKSGRNESVYYDLKKHCFTFEASAPDTVTISNGLDLNAYTGVIGKHIVSYVLGDITLEQLHGKIMRNIRSNYHRRLKADIKAGFNGEYFSGKNKLQAYHVFDGVYAEELVDELSLAYIISDDRHSFVDFCDEHPDELRGLLKNNPHLVDNLVDSARIKYRASLALNAIDSTLKTDNVIHQKAVAGVNNYLRFLAENDFLGDDIKVKNLAQICEDLTVDDLETSLFDKVPKDKATLYLKMFWIYPKSKSFYNYFKKLFKVNYFVHELEASDRVYYNNPDQVYYVSTFDSLASCISGTGSRMTWNTSQPKETRNNYFHGYGSMALANCKVIFRSQHNLDYLNDIIDNYLIIINQANRSFIDRILPSEVEDIVGFIEQLDKQRKAGQFIMSADFEKETGVHIDPEDQDNDFKGYNSHAY